MKNLNILLFCGLLLFHSNAFALEPKRHCNTTDEGCALSLGYLDSRDYGATCNQFSTDDSIGIQAAIDATVTNDQGINLGVYVPNGCKIQTQIVFHRNHVQIFGSGGPRMYNPATPTADNYVFIDSSNIAAHNDGQPCAIDTFGYRDMSINDINMSGQGASTVAYGICSTVAPRDSHGGASPPILYGDNFSINNMNKGIYDQGAFSNLLTLRLTNFTMINNNVGVEGNLPDMFLENFEFSGEDTAIRMLSTVTSGGMKVHNGRLESCAFNDDGHDCIELNGNGNFYGSFQLSNLQFGPVGGCAIGILGGIAGVQLTNIQLTDSGYTQTAGHDGHICFQGATGTGFTFVNVSSNVSSVCASGTCPKYFVESNNSTTASQIAFIGGVAAYATAFSNWLGGTPADLQVYMQGTTPQWKSNPLMFSGGTKFTTSGCSISATAGGSTVGSFTLGANSCSAVVTMNGATGLTAPIGWSCWVQDITAPTVLISQSASSTTTATFAIPGGAGATDVIRFGCMGY